MSHKQPYHHYLCTFPLRVLVMPAITTAGTYRLNVQMCGQTAVWTQPLDSVHILLVSHVEVWEGQHDWDVKVVHCQTTKMRSSWLKMTYTSQRSNAFSHTKWLNTKTYFSLDFN